MGIYDSSRTRVAPVFGRLQCFDPTGRAWLQSLLELGNSRGGARPDAGTSVLRTARWWPKEARLPAPPTLLEWLLRNPQTPESAQAWGRGPVEAKRRRLVDRDAATLDEALRQLGSRPTSARAWYVLEGPSQPDVFLETDDVVVVIEGKRRETRPTLQTEWMAVRHQILRHLDAAWDLRRDRRLYGFFIGEADSGTEPPEVWQRAVADSVTDDALALSLPHRAPEERAAISSALLGVTTWQAVCDEFQVPHQVLIPEVLDPQAERRARRRSSSGIQRPLLLPAEPA